MCGICGIYDENGVDQKNRVQRMMDTMVHRGPDGSGIYGDRNCSLGHRRLAIIDLTERGAQPMSNESGKIWTIVNGEIYNYKVLRAALQRRGHVFRSNCDSEVVVHAYEQYGVNFVNNLRGMFALAVYDSSKRQLFLARDPAGKKPLYYSCQDGQVLFASEIKALFAAGVPRLVNYTAIPSWMQYQYTIGPETLFKQVYKLRAGHLMICSGRSVRQFAYWTPHDQETINDRKTAPKSLRLALDESTRLRLQSDVPVGAFLSGGVDSSAVVALYRKQYSGDLHTFTASFEGKSEAKYAKQVSEHLETIYHEVPIYVRSVERDLDDATWHHDEPLGDAAVLCNYYLAKEAKRKVTVVLAGEGGDELFGGYPWHRFATLLGLSALVPYPVRRASSHIISGDVTSRWYTLHRLLATLNHNRLGDIMLYPTTSMSKASVRWLLQHPGAPANGHRELPAKSWYDRMLMSDFINLLPEKFLMKADKGTMSFGVEERLPLLDRQVLDLAFQFGPQLKKDKWVLRQSVADLLPANITWRPKQGFGTPVGQWMNSPVLKNRVIDRLRSGSLVNEICKQQALRKVVDQFRDGSGSPDRRLALRSVSVIWNLFALQTWHDVWFECPYKVNAGAGK